MRVFVTGGSGLVGRRIVKELLQRGHTPVVLTRRIEPAKKILGPDCALVEGDPMQPGPWQERLAECDAVIHLAGENVFAKRWDDDFKKLLYDSRILSTRHVVQGLSRSPLQANGQPKILINASAIGWYGPHGAEELDEASPPADDVLGRLSVDWEKEAQKVEEAGIRCVRVRVGIVLDREGGALAQLLTPFKLCVGGPVGSGRQYMSWIHYADMVGLFLFPLEAPQARGPMNGTAPNPVTNKEFGNILGKVLFRPRCFWTPAFVLKLAFGEVGRVIAEGQRVLPKKALEWGYRFRFPTLEEALRDILIAKGS